MHDFTGKVAVVTGGASGVGRALVKRLAREGARAIIADIDGEAVERTRRDLSAEGLEVSGHVVDVTRADSVDALAEAVFAEHGTVHLLFNNAGVGVKEAKRRIWTLPENDWKWAYDVNVMGVVNGIRAFVPTMLERGEPGHIVNTSSGNGGIAPLPTTPIYASSKAAVTTITEVLHFQLRMDETALKAHVLYPGPHLVNTNILNSDRSRPDVYRDPGAEPAAYTSMEALAKSAGVDFKLTEPEDVADMAIDGIRADRFWILSEEGRSNAQLERRTRSILERANPELP